MENGLENTSFSSRVSAFFNKAESFYLRALRSVTLVIATLMILYAGWLGLSGIYKISRDVESVVQAEVVVTADDVLAREDEALVKDQSEGSAAKADLQGAQKAFYRDYVSKYLKLYKASFEPYRQKTDPVLTSAEFDKRLLSTNERLSLISKGELDFDEDKAVLDDLYKVMSELATSEKTVAKLKKYRVAKKVEVKRTISGTRPVQTCGYYSYYTGCVYYETNYVPYKTVVKEMAFPKGTVSHLDLFSSYQANYLQLVDKRKAENAASAEEERNEILADNAEGKINIWTAFQVAAAFLMLMFFFLLIAIERHQRKMTVVDPD